jgi:predicted component of type VI protein secretion system
MSVQQRRIGKLVVNLLGAGALIGQLACGSSPAKAPTPPPPKPLHLTFVSATDTNGGTALHVLVRKTNKTDYPRQDYDDVAKSLLLESDPNTLEWVVVTPGSKREIVVARPADTQVGVYFLFADPGARWRHLVDDDSIEYVQFDVGRDQIEQAGAPPVQAQAPARDASNRNAYAHDAPARNTRKKGR